jgi:hypothetical protein
MDFGPCNLLGTHEPRCHYSIINSHAHIVYIIQNSTTKLIIFDGRTQPNIAPLVHHRGPPWCLPLNRKEPHEGENTYAAKDRKNVGKP